MRFGIQTASNIPNSSGEGNQVIDIVTKEPLSILHFRHRSDDKVQMRFFDGATAVSAGSIEFAAKKTGDYSGDLLVYSGSFTLVGSLSSGYYEGFPDFDVQPLNDLFNTGGLKYIDLGLDITWLSGGHRAYTMPIKCRVWNNYLKAADSGVVPPVGQTGLSVVTGVMNGPGMGITSANDLASMATIGISDRSIFIPQLNTSFVMWYLRAGDEAHDPDGGVIRPTDYSASNEKVWIGIL